MSGNVPDPEPFEGLAAADLVAAQLAAHRRRWPFLLAGLAVDAATTYSIITYLDRNETDVGGRVEIISGLDQNAIVVSP